MSGGPRAQAGFLPIVPEDLPEGWSSRAPDEGDVDELIALVSSAKRAVDGSGAVEAELVAQIADVLERLTDPLLRPLRRFIPSLGGVDITPIVLIIGLQFLQILFNRTLAPFLVATLG